MRLCISDFITDANHKKNNYINVATLGRTFAGISHWSDLQALEAVCLSERTGEDSTYQWCEERKNQKEKGE